MMLMHSCMRAHMNAVRTSMVGGLPAFSMLHTNWCDLPPPDVEAGGPPKLRGVNLNLQVASLARLTRAAFLQNKPRVHNIVGKRSEAATAVVAAMNRCANIRASHCAARAMSIAACVRVCVCVRENEHGSARRAIMHRHQDSVVRAA